MELKEDKNHLDTNANDVKKKEYAGKKTLRSGIIVVICFIALVAIALLFIMFSKKNITGVWRMNEGYFSYKANTYDKFAIEFKDNGEYIMYTGTDYTDDYNRGSYMYDKSQITLIVDSAFRFPYNYSFHGNQLSMVTSNGTLTFTKVDLNAVPKSFDASQISQQYEFLGYQVQESKCVSQSTDEKVFHSTISQSYMYMDEIIIREDKYNYSRIGEMWYLSESSDYNVSENWRILGLWTQKHLGGKVTTLSVYSFDGTEASIDYRSGYGTLSYTGTVEVHKWEKERGRYQIIVRDGWAWDSIDINKDDGIEGFTYEESQSITDTYSQIETHNQTIQSGNGAEEPAKEPAEEYDPDEAALKAQAWAAEEEARRAEEEANREARIAGEGITVEYDPALDDVAVMIETDQQDFCAVGNFVKFGHCEQDNNLNNGSEPIEWLVLDVQDGKSLLLSRYGLDAAHPYNNTVVDITWERCTLREWLNHDFLNTSFTEEEQNLILFTDINNSREQGYWNTDGGNNTRDKIFLLSCAEAQRYLGVTIDSKNNNFARVAPTAFALAQGAYVRTQYKTEDGEAAAWWWLRSPGLNQSIAADVSYDGSLSYCNVDNGVFYEDRAVVRPALWLRLD